MIKEKIKKLKECGNYRELKSIEILSPKVVVVETKEYLNFSTNDYLALSDTNIQKQFIKNIDFSNQFLLSTPSSRLMCGNNEGYNLLETKLAKLFKKESSIVLSSGYMVNIGILPALTSKEDLIIADKKVHASIIDGMRLSEAQTVRFKHNSVEHLRVLLEKHTPLIQNIWVAVESIYSMDGDIAPLVEICELKKKYNFKLYVDEAHAFGVRGKSGAGITEELNIADKCEIIVATLGKAAASSGGFLVCSALYREFLINKLRTLIFSTAIPPISLMWSCYIIDVISKSNEKRIHIDRLRTVAEQVLKQSFESHIIPIIIGDNMQCIKTVEELKTHGYLTTAIKSPTVAHGDERIRISLNALMTENEVEKLFKNIKNIRKI